MRIWKEGLLGVYYWASLSARRREAIVRQARQTEPVRVLFYHRVADRHRNDWTISRRGFAAQVDWLRSRFDLVSLAEAQQRIAAGRNRWPTACITFDDGYAENGEFAIPLLLKHHVPFTYFVSTDHVLRGRPFPHDEARGQPLRPNSLAELRELVAAGGVVGAHTRSHARLTTLDPNQMDDEIRGSKEELQEALNTPVRYFAFPYGQPGDMSTDAFHLASEAGVDGVCSAYGGYNFPGGDEFHIRRFHADIQMVRFKNWLTVDPRKLAQPEPFCPGDYRQEGTAATEASLPEASLSHTV